MILDGIIKVKCLKNISNVFILLILKFVVGVWIISIMVLEEYVYVIRRFVNVFNFF